MIARRGLTLLEVLAAVAILALVGLALFGALRSGSQGAPRAGEVQLASTVTSRVMDRLLAGLIRRLAGLLAPLRFQVSNLPGGLVAAHFGHLAIHEDDIIGSAFQRPERLGAIRHGIGHVPEFFQLLKRHLPVER